MRANKPFGSYLQGIVNVIHAESVAQGLRDVKDTLWRRA
jgi:hypothetical protein